MENAAREQPIAPKKCQAQSQNGTGPAQRRTACPAIRPRPAPITPPSASGPPRKRLPTWPAAAAVEVFVESVADLPQIQNRTGDRKAAVEMAFEDGLGGRADVKRLFRHPQQIRAAKAEPAELERVVSLCRQVAESLEPAERAKEKTQAVDLQKRATRSAQEAARHARAARPA
jgi:hypothetical protein